ncbi:RadC family protein [Cetobacterium sp. 2G large]|uniref:JAB domain-containing protein n=1 Tax=Cetobacterium sp. 2G large TaxID=2759680 RepID=UPI00163B72E4|nr:JAB domain-containing protein [Cetobacterium sp. 2G large]MBC2854699.1 JAB domain-containing protein [Cetobacterium sp. 2G large]
MKKILKFLKCKDIEEVVTKIKSYEINEELEQFKELMITIAKGNIVKKDLTTVKGKTELLNYLRTDIGFKNLEEFKVIYLSSSNRLIGEETLFRGTVDRSVVYPRLIVERALKYPTKGIIFAHNHPSGSLTPSKKDIVLTQELKDLLDVLDIKLLDHIILGDGDHFSFYENGLIEY